MIVVDVTSTSGLRFMTKTAVREIVGFVCSNEKVTSAEFSFVIVNDAMIRSINKKFLNHDYVTDIITFPMEQKSIVAEIYINARQLSRQAKELGVTKRNEMTRLVVHGILHAIGYEDTTAAKKKKMDAVQERYVAALSSKE